jgi:hypothetical protein
MLYLPAFHNYLPSAQLSCTTIADLQSKVDQLASGLYDGTAQAQKCNRARWSLPRYLINYAKFLQSIGTKITNMQISGLQHQHNTTW